MLLLLLFACTDDAETPSIVILTPEDGATVCGSPLHVETEVTGIELVDPYPPPGTEAKAGTGHIDVTLNGQDVNMAGTPTFDVDVEDGEWQLKVELSNADHIPLEPYAGDFVYITADPEACP